MRIRSAGTDADAVVAAAVALVYAGAKVGHALDGRIGIPGGPTVASTDGSEQVATQQWMLVLLGLLAAVIAVACLIDVSTHGFLVVARWTVASGVAVLTTLGAVVIVSALFEPDPLRWSQPIAAAVACSGAGAWLHLAHRLRPWRRRSDAVSQR